MAPKRSLNITLRICDVPDDEIATIKSLALVFRNDVLTTLNCVKDDDHIYYDFNITDAEWFDPEFDDEPRRRPGRRLA